MGGRTVVDEASVLRFRTGTRLKYDEPRTQWVILAPERMFVLDDIGTKIMQGVDGAASVATLVDDLAARFDAPREAISGDVIELLQDFADKGVLTT